MVTLLSCVAGRPKPQRLWGRLMCVATVVLVCHTSGARTQCEENCISKFEDCAQSTFECLTARDACLKRCRDSATNESRLRKAWADARLALWDSYAEMKNLIATKGTTSRHISYADVWQYAARLSPGYSNPLNISVSTPMVPKEHLKTPHYWLLFAIGNGNFEYDQGRNGVPLLEIGSGLYYFAKGLNPYFHFTGRGCPRRTSAENDLLFALYMAADGVPNDAAPLVDGTVSEVPHVRRTTKDWMKANLTYEKDLDREFRLAYLYNTLTKEGRNSIDKPPIRDRILAEFALGTLANVVGGAYRRIYVSMVKRNELAGLHGMYPGNRERYPAWPVVYYAQYIAHRQYIERPPEITTKCSLSVAKGHFDSDGSTDYREATWKLIGPDPNFDGRSP